MKFTLLVVGRTVEKHYITASYFCRKLQKNTALSFQSGKCMV